MGLSVKPRRRALDPHQRCCGCGLRRLWICCGHLLDLGLLTDRQAVRQTHRPCTSSKLSHKIATTVSRNLSDFHSDANDLYRSTDITPPLSLPGPEPMKVVEILQEALCNPRTSVTETSLRGSCFCPTILFGPMRHSCWEFHFGKTRSRRHYGFSTVAVLVSWSSPAAITNASAGLRPKSWPKPPSQGACRPT